MKKENDITIVGLRTPDRNKFKNEKIQRMEQTSIKIADAYNKIVKGSKKFTSGEVMDKILMLSEELSKVSDYNSLKTDGENSLIEPNDIKKFIGDLNSGRINKVTEIRIYTDTDKKLKIKGDYTIFKVMCFLQNLDSPVRESRKRGGQAGSTIQKNIIRDFAKDMFSMYRKFFETKEQAYLLISDLLEIPENLPDGEKRTPDNIKHLIH
jgi:hypothetical protein